jgi:hypothetical protein
VTFPLDLDSGKFRIHGILQKPFHCRAAADITQRPSGCDRDFGPFVVQQSRQRLDRPVVSDVSECFSGLLYLRGGTDSQQRDQELNRRPADILESGQLLPAGCRITFFDPADECGDGRGGGIYIHHGINDGYREPDRA